VFRRAGFVYHGVSRAARRRMRRANPRCVLRDHLAQNAIEAAVRERGYGEIDRLLGVLRSPFDEHPGCERYAREPPDWARGLQLSCSSWPLAASIRMRPCGRY